MSATTQLLTGRRPVAVVLVVAVLSALSLSAQAVVSPPASPTAAAHTVQAVPPVLARADRDRILAALAAALRERYVFPEVAERVIAGLTRKAGEGGYAAATDPESFGTMLTDDLRALGEDRHLEVRLEPGLTPLSLAEEDAPPTAAELGAARRAAAEQGFGLGRVERLAGNVGYLEVLGFWPVDLTAPAIDAAFTLLAGSRALILDLRRNKGGRPEGVSYLLSYLFAEGDARHLNDIYDRPRNRTRQFWTGPVPGPRFTGPVVVLTSAETFSAGEECAYDLQQQKRATLMGDVTGGGANPGSPVALGSGLVAFVPSARAINPVSGTNWEHVGVRPDVAVSAADALKAAHLAVLKQRLDAEKDPRVREELEAALAGARQAVAGAKRTDR